MEARRDKGPDEADSEAGWYPSQEAVRRATQSQADSARFWNGQGGGAAPRRDKADDDGDAEAVW